jgi:hypothetical protein
MTASRFNGHAPSLEADTPAGFGRGSAVREYWLERCHGFSAVGADGRPLGRVKRVETRMEGTFLRLSGIRAREVPVAAIETVWPSASMLRISAEQPDVRSREAPATEARSDRPVWEDETLPWWELFADGVRSTHPSTAATEGRRSFPSLASGRAVLVGTAEGVISGLRGLNERARSLAKTLMDEAVRSGVRTSRAARSAAARASTGLAQARRRARRKIGRKLFALAIWIAGSRETILDPDPRDGRGGVEDEDTAEIA